MEDKINFVEPLLERVEEFGKTSYELFRLKTLEKTVEVLSAFVSIGIVLFVVSIFFSLSTIGLSLWLGDLMGKSYYGFFCMAGLYIIISVFLYFAMNRWMKKRISNSILLRLFN